jgi:hypothetical protein
MKLLLNKFFLIAALGICIFSIKSNAQDFTLAVDHTAIVDTVGSEMIFHLVAINTSENVLTLYIARTLNELPPNWQSSLCLAFCAAPFVDTIETTSEWGSSPLASGDTAFIELHVSAYVNSGTGNLRIEVGNVENTSDTISYDLTASAAEATGIEQTNKLDKFGLFQNYPNPFNPTTTIVYNIPQRSNVSLKVYDLTGREIATLVQEVQEAGSHSVNFNAEKLSSGVYFYKITAGKFISVKKMILMK